MTMETSVIIAMGLAHKGAGAWTSVLTLINAAVGAGVLSFPFAFRCTGWLAGLVVTALVAAVESCTLYQLSFFAEQTHSANYTELMRSMLGPGAALACSLTLLGYIWGSGVAYLVVVGDCLQPLLRQALGVAWFTERGVVIAGYACAVILPLCFPRRLSALAALSALNLYGIVIVVGAVILRSVQIVGADPDPWADVAAVSLSWRFISALPIIVFAFQCHTNVIAVFDELDHSPSLFRRGAPVVAAPGGSSSSGGTAPLGQALGYDALPAPEQANKPPARSAKLGGMKSVVVAAIAITCFFYSTLGLSGYLAFPLTAHSNILTNFPPGDPLLQVGRAMVAIIVTGSYAVMHNPARSTVRDMLYQYSGLYFDGLGFNVAETLAFFGSTLAVALAVADLGTVFQLIGGTGGALLIFCFPGLLLMQHAHSGAGGGRHGQGPAAEPLLQEAPSAEGGGAAGGAAGVPLARRGGGHWTAPSWWAGLALVAISLGLFGVTAFTVFGPKPPA